MADPSNFYLELSSTVGTIGAAVLAAVSAWIANQSAKATKATVEEARLARRHEVLPRFIFERNFKDLSLHWPHPASLNGEPVYLARKHWKDTDPSAPTFTLSNFGQSPAFDIKIVFALVNIGLPNVPTAYNAIGLSDQPMPGMPGDALKPMLCYRLENGQAGGLALYRKQIINLPNSVPGQSRSIDFPQGILSRLFVRGLQYPERLEDGGNTILEVTVSGLTVEEDTVSSKFRFHVYPFCHGPQLHIKVFSHFWELPRNPDTAEELSSEY